MNSWCIILSFPTKLSFIFNKFNNDYGVNGSSDSFSLVKSSFESTQIRLKSNPPLNIFFLSFCTFRESDFFLNQFEPAKIYNFHLVLDSMLAFT